MMKFKVIILIVLSVLLLTSCFDDTPQSIEREYVSVDVTYSESTAKYGFRLNMDYTETKFAKYFFEASVDNETREACIVRTDKTLADQLFQDVLPEIYIFSQGRYEYKYIENHKLYSSVRDWDTVEYISDVLLVAYGGQAHYGTVFGYANYLARDLQFECYKGDFANPSVIEVLDLNYLCFDEKFVNHSDIATAKNIACDFVDSYIDKYGEQEIKRIISSHSKSIDSLSAYYAENGVSYIPSLTQYGYGGKSYDYIVYSDFGTFYIANDWVDIHAELNPLINDGFLHSDYLATKTFFEVNLRQMKQYQDLFSLDDYNNDLDIVFAKSMSDSPNSFYNSADHRISLYNVDSLMHEYIHALTVPTYSMQNWQVEGFARYFSYYYDYYGIAFLNQDYNNTPYTPTTKWVHEYLNKIDRPIDVEKDYCELENIAMHFFGFTDPNENYLSGSSFVPYLVKQYGEEAVVNFIYQKDNSLPKTYFELVKDWQEFIEVNYDDYSRYDRNKG